MTFSSDLIYDVLYKYEPDHILLRAARDDATRGLIDTDRLAGMLDEFQGRLVIRHHKKVTPLAVPLMLEIAKESVSRREKGDYLLEDLEQDLLQEAGIAQAAESQLQ